MSIPFVIFSFLLIISFIVVIHEYGHYAAGRAFGLIGTHFSLGFGKKLIGWTDKRGTEWRIAPILLGGYVRFPGDNPDVPLKPGQKTLKSLPRWQRAIVVGAGPGINLVLAAVLFAIIAGFWGYPVGKPIIQEVVEGTPAAQAGFIAGDRITAINGNKIVTPNDVTENTILRPNYTVKIDFLRNDEKKATNLKIGEKIFEDSDGNPAKIGFLGVVFNTEIKKASNPIEAMSQGVSDGVFMTWAQIENMRQIISGERSVTEISGPVRIARATAKSISLGLMPFLYLAGVISIAVAVMNLLPIPGLDGGHLAIYAVEGIIQKDLSEKSAERLARAGLTIVACLGIFALTLDYIALR